MSGKSENGENKGKVTDIEPQALSPEVLPESEKPLQAGRDSRTNMPNRDSFYREIGPLLEDAAAKKEALVLLDIDIDRVDFALRIFGPKERDDLVAEVGERLRAATRRRWPVYHITQGRFAVVLNHVSHREATQMAQAIIRTFQDPFDLDSTPYRLIAQVGISHFPNHATTLGEWVRTSVFAAHQARLTRSGYAIYDKAWSDRERKRFELVTDLEQALDSPDQIQIAYQPQIDMETGKCIGVEALCRWMHPRQGYIPPDHFLPYVERTALILPLTEAVLGTALCDAARWQERGFDGHVAVNLSPALFRERDLEQHLEEHFRFSNLAPEKVHFEITETGIMDESENCIRQLERIRKQGSRIAIDDFGRGHSSLAYLADLPIDSLKIDKHFVKNLSSTSSSAAIIAATCTLAKSLGLTITAEGVETEDQETQCRDLGCTASQGFFHAHPMFRDAFEEWLGI